MEHDYQIHEITGMDTGLLVSETRSGEKTTVFHVWDGNRCTPKAWYVASTNEFGDQQIVDLIYSSTARQGHGAAPISCRECDAIGEPIDWNDGLGTCPNCGRITRWFVPHEFFFRVK